VLLDVDLAELYGVETKRLNEQVRRNISRFPADFMFQLDEVEYAGLRSQFATSSSQVFSEKEGGMEKAHVDLLRIERSIRLIRGDKVILDEDLSELYGVETKNLIKAVKRNLDRFPADFMFQLTNQEFADLRFQTGTSSQWGGRRTSPYAFSEQGVAMLSSVLHSPRAIQVNVEIMRTFVRLRRILASHADLAERLEALEQKYDAQFRVVFDAIRQMMQPAEKGRKEIGFKVEEDGAAYV
jgi:hypothetical protein